MSKAKDIQPDTRFFGLFLGRSGSGKSAAAYSFPHPLMVLDLDGRVRGGLTSWIDRTEIDYIYFPPNDTTPVFDRLDAEFEKISALCKMGQNPFKTVVLDSLTWASTDFLLDAIPLTHKQNRGKRIGTLEMAGPADYGFQSSGIWQAIAFLKTIPIQNVIVTAHIVNRWGKRKDAHGEIIDPYGPNEIIGEQLFLTDKLSESVPSSFDHIFKFEKSNDGRKFYFESRGELARTAFSELPFGRTEITNRNFYEGLMNLVKPTGQPMQPDLKTRS